MQNQQRQWVRTWTTTAALALATVGLSLAQAPGPDSKTSESKTKPAAKAPKGGLRAPGGAPPKKFHRNAADPFANPPVNPQAQAQVNPAPAWPFHYKFKITGADGVPLAAAYYPSQRGTAPVLMLVHEKGRSSKDFEDGIEDLKNKGLAEYLQDQGYAVLVLDLRGHGANPRREIGPRESGLLISDLQAAYQFLVDRHNREELNLAKFGVIAIGEGANLATAWAATPGGAVSSEGRISDLGALVLISPLAEGFGIRLTQLVSTVAPRVPLLILVGERDAASLNPVHDVQPAVVRQRQSKVEIYSTSLHGYKLLRFQPKVADAITTFFEASIKKVRSEEWEPRYNLTPVAYSDIELVSKKAAGAAAPAKAEEVKKAAAKDEDAKKAPAKDEEAKTAPSKDEADVKKAPEKTEGSSPPKKATGKKRQGK